MQERFLSVIHHITNRHVFTGNKFYTKCDHEPYSREGSDERQWLHMGHPAHNILKKVIEVPQLVKDLAKMNENVFTTYLEVFHSLKIKYLPKSTFFEQEKMIAGAYLAAMDHNNNISRGHVSGYIIFVETFWKSIVITQNFFSLFKNWILIFIRLCQPRPQWLFVSCNCYEGNRPP